MEESYGSSIFYALYRKMGLSIRSFGSLIVYCNENTPDSKLKTYILKTEAMFNSKAKNYGCFKNYYSEHCPERNA